MDVEDPQRPLKVVDSNCELVRDLFAAFLEEYVVSPYSSLQQRTNPLITFSALFYALIATLQTMELLMTT